MIFYCVEPTDARIGRDRYDWNFLIKSGFSHHVTFPHVDSCLAVVADLGGGRIFAGHINGFCNNDFSTNSHRQAFDAMLAQLGGAGVNRAVFFGDQPNWSTHLNPAARLNCPNVTYMDSSDGGRYPSGVDVMFDIDSGHVKLMAYQANRDFRTAVPTTQVNLYTVALGVNRVPCN